MSAQKNNFQIKALQNPALHENLKALSLEERRLTHEIILHIMEVDRRKLYSEMNYPSLFEYLVKEMGYSNGSAQRRIDAARLMIQVPGLGKKIEQGCVKLSQVTQAQKAFRLFQKTNQSRVSAEIKQDLIEKLENKTFQETEQLIAQAFDLPLLNFEKTRMQKDASIRLEMTFSKQEMEILEYAKTLLSHTLAQSSDSGKFKSLLLYCAKKVIQQKTGVRKSDQTSDGAGDRNSVRSTTATTSTTTTAAATVASESKETLPQTLPLKSVLKKQILNWDQCCQYQTPLTREKCQSKYFLEIDHIQPRWAGGQNKVQNLRILCRAHNQYRYEVGR